MMEKLTLDERRERARRLSHSINSLRTAFRYGLEQSDAGMIEEIKQYASSVLDLNGLEINYVYYTAVDEKVDLEEKDGKDI